LLGIMGLEMVQLTTINNKPPDINLVFNIANILESKFWTDSLFLVTAFFSQKSYRGLSGPLCGVYRKTHYNNRRLRYASHSACCYLPWTDSKDTSQQPQASVASHSACFYLPWTEWSVGLYLRTHLNNRRLRYASHSAC
jgi:hypothetical protein